LATGAVADGGITNEEEGGLGAGRGHCGWIGGSCRQLSHSQDGRYD
jgi:hypothetical protein